MVLKPSEHASLTCLALAALASQAGLPRGALNVVTGLGKDAGAALARHPGLAKVAFTGSSFTGREVAMASAALASPRPVSLELGGKSSLIVFEDADIPKAVEWAMFGAFWTNGQICSATSRLLIARPIAAAFHARLKARAEQIQIGMPLDPGCRLGPLVNRAQFQRVLGFIDRARRAGLALLTGGERWGATGFFVRPTVFADVPRSSEIWSEEVFGPVLCTSVFDDEKEAVAAANDTRYGLAAAVLSSDRARCRRVAKALDVGIVWENCSQPCFVEMPWGGRAGKASGYGRDLGVGAFESYRHTKAITTYDADADVWDWYGKAEEEEEEGKGGVLAKL